MEETKEKTHSGETYKFRDKDGVFDLVVRAEFLKKVNKPQDYTFLDLLTQYDMAGFLHNSHGPAIFVERNGHEEFWLEGKKCTDDVVERIKHNVKFNDSLESILDS